MPPKPCKPDQVRNPDTGRCRKSCKADEERNPANGNCRKSCKPGQVRNHATGRCIKKPKSPRRAASPRRSQSPRRAASPRRSQSPRRAASPRRSQSPRQGLTKVLIKFDVSISNDDENLDAQDHVAKVLKWYKKHINFYKKNMNRNVKSLSIKYDNFDRLFYLTCTYSNGGNIENELRNMVIDPDDGGNDPLLINGVEYLVSGHRPFSPPISP